MKWFVLTVLSTALIACTKEPPKPDAVAVNAVCDWPKIDRCYAAYQPERGTRAGRLSAWIPSDGRVIRARYDLGDALEAVQACLIDHAQRQALNDFQGRAGRVDCSWAGEWRDGKFAGWRKKQYLIH